MKRGRKSMAALSVVPIDDTPPQRPPPPERLDEFEAMIWRHIVDARPPEYFDIPACLMLRMLCTHIRNCELLAEQLREVLKTDASDKDERVDALTIRHRDEAQAAERLLTKLRLSPQSRYRPDVAHTRLANMVRRRRPWENEDDSA